MFDWYYKVILNYTNFSGRARRQEYWYFTLINALISIAITFADALMGTYNPALGAGFFGIIYGLAVFIPTLAVTFRRLHDTGRSGWWLLILIVPLLGALIMLVFLLLDSNSGPNRYGENPKADELFYDQH